MCLQVLFPLAPLQLQTYWSDLLPYNNFLIVNTTTYSLLWLLKYDPVTDEFGQFIRLIQIIFTHLKLPILLMNFKVPTNVYFHYLFYIHRYIQVVKLVIYII